MVHRRLVVSGALLALVVMVGCERGNAAPGVVAQNEPAGQAASADGVRPAPVPDTTGNALIKRTVFEVTTDVNKISVASPEEQKRLLPAHISYVNGMLSRFEDKVRSMHVKADPDWVAVIDSVRVDVKKMPGMSTAQLHAFLPEHNRRVMRIVACVDMTRL